MAKHSKTKPGHKSTVLQHKATAQCDRNLVHHAAAGKFKGGVMKTKKGKGAYTRRDTSWRESFLRSVFAVLKALLR